MGNFDNIKKLVNNSDQVVVSTSELKNRFDKLGIENVDIIKNYYVNDYLPLRPFRGFYSLAKLRNINSHIQMKTVFFKKHSFLGGDNMSIKQKHRPSG